MVRTWIYVEDGADRISLLAWLFFVRGVGGVWETIRIALRC